MGYDDETGRSPGSRGRGRQPVKRPGDREPAGRRAGRSEYTDYGGYPDYGYRSESGYGERGKGGRGQYNRSHSEPELNLITDTFERRSDRSRQTRQEAATQEPRRSRKRSASPKDKDMAGDNYGGGSGSRGGNGSHGGNGSYGGNGSRGGGSDRGGKYQNQTPAWKKARKRKRKILIILFEVALLLSVIAFAAYSYLDSKLSGIHKLEWNPEENRNVNISEEKQEQMKGYWTIAVFGVDSRNSSVGEGNNSDVNIICNINQDTGEIKMVSVYRDTYLNVNDKNSYNKLNSAYLHGGPDQAVKALNKNLDLDIDDYVTFNWKAVADIINILDGVDLEISKAEFYYMNAFITETVKATGIPSVPLKKAGMNHLDGVQAVAYGRLRLMDTDYARTERQRKIIQLAFDKARTADWATLNNIIQTAYGQVSTSVDLTDVLRMGRGIGKLHLGETTGFPQARGDANMGGKGACVIPQTLESNVVELHEFLFGDENYEPSDMVKTFSKKIASDSGKAKAAKPAESVGTGGGSVPKSTQASGESKKETSSSAKEPGSGAGAEHESGETGESARETREPETDANGNLILHPSRAPQESTGAGRPGGSTETGLETEESHPGQYPGGSETGGTTQSENNVPKPGGGSGSETNSGMNSGTNSGGAGGNGTGNSGNGNAPGGSTDTGVIIGPVNGNSPGGQNNAPGGSSNPGGYVPQNAPGSGNSGTADGSGSGSGNVEFSGPSGQ